MASATIAVLVRSSHAAVPNWLQPKPTTDMESEPMLRCSTGSSHLSHDACAISPIDASGPPCPWRELTLNPAAEP